MSGSVRSVRRILAKTAASAAEVDALTDLAPLNIKRQERSACTRCGGTLTASERAGGTCPQCDADAAGGKPQRARERLLRTNSSLVKQASSPHFEDAEAAKNHAHNQAAQDGHHLGEWRPSGDDDHATNCTQCGRSAYVIKNSDQGGKFFASGTGDRCPGDQSGATYQIIRQHRDPMHPDHGRVIRSHLSLDQAQAHCKDPRTAEHGPDGLANWFDTFHKENSHAENVEHATDIARMWMLNDADNYHNLQGLANHSRHPLEWSMHADRYLRGGNTEGHRGMNEELANHGLTHDHIDTDALVKDFWDEREPGQAAMQDYATDYDRRHLGGKSARRVEAITRAIRDGSFERMKQIHDNYRGTKHFVPMPHPNTSVWKDTAGNYHLRLHNTDVVSYNEDGSKVTLNHGGWRTPTTASRINGYMPAGMSATLSQRGQGWERRPAPAYGPSPGVPYGLENTGPRVYVHGRGEEQDASGRVRPRVEHWGDQHHITLDSATGQNLSRDGHIEPVGGAVKPPKSRQARGYGDGPRRSPGDDPSNTRGGGGGYDWRGNERPYSAPAYGPSSTPRSSYPSEPGDDYSRAHDQNELRYADEGHNLQVPDHGPAWDTAFSHSPSAITPQDHDEEAALPGEGFDEYMKRMRQRDLDRMNKNSTRHEAVSPLQYGMDTSRVPNTGWQVRRQPKKDENGNAVLKGNGKPAYDWSVNRHQDNRVTREIIDTSRPNSFLPGDRQRSNMRAPADGRSWNDLNNSSNPYSPYNPSHPDHAAPGSLGDLNDPSNQHSPKNPNHPHNPANPLNTQQAAPTIVQQIGGDAINKALQVWRQRNSMKASA